MMEQTNRKRAPLLEMEGFRVLFPGRKGPLPAVDGGDLTLYPGEVVGNMNPP